MTRGFSVLLRKLHSIKNDRRTLIRFNSWQEYIKALPSAEKSRQKKLLFIRLDDIGDYLLFRNSFSAFKASPKWSGYEFTLLGNKAWQNLFDTTDKDCADKTIWIDKKLYYSDEQYRIGLWKQLKQEGFHVVICPSRTRPFLLDDMCATAADAEERIACENTFQNTVLNTVSDKLYTKLFKKEERQHEFFFNQQFANWCCDSHLNGDRPSITDSAKIKTINEPYILCNIGATTKGRRWTSAAWIEFISLCRKTIPQYTIVLSGGKAELSLAEEIISKATVHDITGKTTLQEMISWTYGAAVVVGNNSMASHLGVCCNVPTIILTNGDNYPRFAEYEQAGIKNTKTVFTTRFLKTLQHNPQKAYWYFMPVTKDIKSISAETVFNGVLELLKK